MNQLQPAPTANTATVLNIKYSDCETAFIYSNRLFEGISTRNFAETIMGKDKPMFKYVQNAFCGKDASLSLVDYTADTPFRCILLALFIKQLGELLNVNFTSIHLYITPIRKINGYSAFFDSADSRYDSTSARNAFLQQALDKITGKKVLFSCKGNHFLKEDIKLSCDDYTMHIRPVRPDGGLTRGWLTEKGDFPFMSSQELLTQYSADIPCYNEHSRTYKKNGVQVYIELERNHSTPFYKSN